MEKCVGVTIYVLTKTNPLPDIRKLPKNQTTVPAMYAKTAMEIKICSKSNIWYCACVHRAEQSVATASAQVPADHAQLGGASCIDILDTTGTHRGKCK